MKVNNPIRVYGPDEDLDLIRKHAKSNNLSVSLFLRRLGLAEIKRHPKGEALEEMIRRIIQEEMDKKGESKW